MNNQREPSLDKRRKTAQVYASKDEEYQMSQYFARNRFCQTSGALHLKSEKERKKGGERSER